MKHKFNIKNIKFNKKTIKIIETVAIIVIIIIIISVSIPMINNMKESKKKKEYLDNVNTYVDRATTMYGNEKYRNNFTKNGDSYKISFDKIDKVNILKDPYGFSYRKGESYVVFNTKTKDIIVNVRSCTTEDGINYCYEIADVNTKDLKTNSIKTTIN